jgi:pyruvate-formate lyase-activating enzyme
MLARVPRERSLTVACVLAFGEPDEGFFPDTLLAQFGAVARARGCDVAMLRVYYDGRDPARDAEISARLTRWLDARRADLVVVDRIVDPEPLRAQRTVYVSRGESFDPIDGVGFVLGAHAGMTRTGTRRTPTIDALLVAFGALLDALAEGRDPLTVEGVARVEGDRLVEGSPLPPFEGARAPYRAETAWEVIARGPSPPVVRKTLFGNVGCPFAADPLENPHYARVRLPVENTVARLGCAFCDLGGDYEKRPDAEVIAHLVEQAHFWSTHAPAVTELVLADQHATRYLARLLMAAHEAGVRPMRWLFAARVDTLVRERARVEAAIEAARATGQSVELYLAGFEAFSDDELGRYNKGVTVREQLAAVGAMRALARTNPGVFDYARVRGHSLILWNPWTRPTDLQTSLDTIRAHGLGELFHEMGRNRLRLYGDLPIAYAAERDGALRDTWEDGDTGAGRRKGYNPERPWRFLDARTRLAYTLAQRLRERLGHETEVGQLRAIARYTAALDASSLDVNAHLRDILAGLDDLRAVFDRLCNAHAQGERGRVVRFTGACNNRCDACSNADSWLPDDRDAVLARVREARRGGLPVVLGGREPTIHGAFLDAVRAARGDDGRAVSVVTNGRRFVYEPFARASLAAGLRAASVKLFATDAETADAITRSPGAHAQSLGGVRALVKLGLRAVELRAPVYATNLADLARYADVTRSLGASQVRVEVALDAVGLARLGDTVRAIEALATRCREVGVALMAAPLTAGTTAFERVYFPV